MSEAKQTVECEEKQVDDILSGLTGDLRLGQIYYIQAIPFHFIGRVSRVNETSVTLDPVIGVSNAGGEDNAVSQIVAGKRKPQNCENMPAPVTIRQGFISVIMGMAAMPKV